MSTTFMKAFTFCASVAAVVLSSGTVNAGPRGSEFDLTLTPATGAMEGAGMVRPQDPVAMLFGNPATLTQLEGKNTFLIGSSYVSPELEASGFNAFAGGRFDGASRNTELVLPHAAAVHRINDKLLAGMGVTGVSGLGSDFRDVFNEFGQPVGVIAELKLFGGNIAAAYQVTPRLSVGAAVTVGIGSLQVGVFTNTASVNALGVGGTFGVTYDLGLVQAGAKFKTPLSIEYENVVQTTPTGVASDFTLEQPAEFGFGLATTDRLLENTHFEVDFSYKQWDSAEGYDGFWKNSYVVSLGGQHKLRTPIGPFFLRAGYSYHSEILKDAEDLGNNIGKLTQVFIPGAGVIPVTPGFIQLFQATATDGYWTQSVSLGLGYQILEGLRLDLNTSYAFDGFERLVTVDDPFPGIVNDLEVDGSIFSAGMGLTWTFN